VVIVLLIVIGVYLMGNGENESETSNYVSELNGEERMANESVFFDEE
jgi:hypothetical protein